jgi:hypothetical protein
LETLDDGLLLNLISPADQELLDLPRKAGKNA